MSYSLLVPIADVCLFAALAGMHTNIASDYMTGKKKLNMEGYAIMRKTCEITLVHVSGC